MARFTWVKAEPFSGIFEKMSGGLYTIEELKTMNGVFPTYDDAVASAVNKGNESSRVYVIMLREGE